MVESHSCSIAKAALTPGLCGGVAADKTWAEKAGVASKDQKNKKEPNYVDLKAAQDMILNGEKVGAAESMLAQLRVALLGHRRFHALNLLTDTGVTEVHPSRQVAYIPPSLSPALLTIRLPSLSTLTSSSFLSIHHPVLSETLGRS